MEIFRKYSTDLSELLRSFDWESLASLANALLRAWKCGNMVYVCGNGGSAGNANHITNDFTYGIAPNSNGLRIESLNANASVLTCLANDLSYEHVFSRQLKTRGQKDDILIVLSGSGNSPNILEALEAAEEIKMKTFAILGFDGGKAKALADESIHFAINDMQISEDCQLIVGHMLMKYLKEQAKNV